MASVRVKLKSDGSIRLLDSQAAYTLIKLRAATYIEGQLPTDVPVDVHGFEHTKRLIAVITCHGKKFMEQADMQRQTWVPLCAQYGFDVKFFLGQSTRPAREDEVYLDVDDGYAGLPAKVKAMFAWSAALGYDYTLKTDDDVYIIPGRLSNVPVAPHDFIGRFRPPSGGYPAEYASGFAYWLSRHAASVVAATPLNKDWAEDRWVANALAVQEIFGMADWVNYVAPCPPVAPDVIGRCGVAVATVFCQFTAQEIQRMHVIFKDRPLIVAPHALHVAPRYQCTAERLARDPGDKIPNRPEHSYVSR